MKTDELIDKVTEWGRSHQITNPDKQALKVVEEVGEIVREIVRGRYDSFAVQDGIGDALVTIIILADILDMDARDCLAVAYDTVKKREGQTKDGCFIKADE